MRLKKLKHIIKEEIKLLKEQGGNCANKECFPYPVSQEGITGMNAVWRWFYDNGWLTQNSYNEEFNPSGNVNDTVWKYELYIKIII